ncbi:hypothetical protein [Reinekea blandensis]|nr:hypothetical protein [Reinekea blandensis]
MMKKTILAAAVSVALATPAFAGGKGGTELALANYSGLGFVASQGIPLDIAFLRSNGINTFGEIEVGAGFADGLAIGAELSGGLLIGLSTGLSLYGSLGPAISGGESTQFGLGFEVGLNIDVNQSSIVIEGGSHPSESYVGVGLRF